MGSVEDIGMHFSQYEILNNLVPGALTCFSFRYLSIVDFQFYNWIEQVIIYYIIGLILGRIGSLVFEPVMKKSKLVTYANYDDYVEARHMDSGIATLVRTCNMYRTIASSCLVISVIAVYARVGMGRDFQLECLGLLVLLFMTFTWAFIKQSGYVCKRVEAVIKHQKAR